MDGILLSHYIDSLAAEGKSSATINRSIASLKCFYQFILLREYLPKQSEDLFCTVKLQYCQKKVPQILTSEEVEKLLNCPDLTDDKGIRDRAMLEILYATGIRVSELI